MQNLANILPPFDGVGHKLLNLDYCPFDVSIGFVISAYLTKEHDFFLFGSMYSSVFGISDFTEEESLMICKFMKCAIEMAMCNQCGYQVFAYFLELHVVFYSAAMISTVFLHALLFAFTIVYHKQINPINQDHIFALQNE